MTGLVPDANIEGQFAAMVGHLRRSAVADLWDNLALDVRTFAERGWSRELPDREVWRLCQQWELVLVTDNRNDDGPDSLESTLRDSVGPDSLPVVTVSDKDALRTDRGYAERVAADLLELLFDIREYNLYRGAGRVFLPLSRATPLSKT